MTTWTYLDWLLVVAVACYALPLTALAAYAKGRSYREREDALDALGGDSKRTVECPACGEPRFELRLNFTTFPAEALANCRECGGVLRVRVTERE